MLTSGQKLISSRKIFILEIDMAGRRKKELIEESLNIEKRKDNLSSEEGRNIGEARRAYTQAAQYFEKKVADDEKKKTKNANRLSIFFGVIAFISIGAVLGLTPLKTVVPYVIRVDNNSGYTDIVRSGADQDITTTDDAYWAVNYVLQRESYNFSTQDNRSKYIEITSYNGTYTEYKNFQLSKKGYLELLGDKQQIRVKIRNVSKPQKSADNKLTIIQIRFTKNVLDDVGVPVGSILPTTWLATISFDYGRTPKTKENEWMNPRGFGVRSYDLSQEVGN
jgi:type IV secretion system protein VirB8